MRALLVGLGAATILSTAWSLPSSMGVAIAAILATALVTGLAQRRFDPQALLAGAIGAALLLGPLRETMFGAAGFVLAIHAERLRRARDPLSGVLVGGLALGAGLGLGALHDTYAHSMLQLQWAAFIAGAVGASLAAIPRVDDPIALAIRKAAGRQRGRLKIRLLRALSLRRRAELPAGPRAVRDALRLGWEGLAEMAESGDRERIQIRVRALENAHAAAEKLDAARGALMAGPDGVRDAHERLNHELAALEELRAA